MAILLSFMLEISVRKMSQNNLKAENPAKMFHQWRDYWSMQSTAFSPNDCCALCVTLKFGEMIASNTTFICHWESDGVKKSY